MLCVYQYLFIILIWFIWDGDVIVCKCICFGVNCLYENDIIGNFIFFLFCFLIINFLIIVQLEGKLKFFKFYIFFMLVDDFGWIDVGYYGLKIYILNLDLLVKDGVILDNFYV